jgi:alpha-mannosidase
MILLDHVTEYELVQGRELALTVLRSTGLISRNDNPFREDPAGPEVPVPGAQMIVPWRFGFAVLPHAGPWDEPAVQRAATAYQLPFVTAAGVSVPGESDRTGRDDAGGAPRVSGTDAEPGAAFRVDGDGVVLTALRRRGEWLEARLVVESASPVEALIRGSFDAARRVDLVGRAGADLPLVEPGVLTIPLGAWEIATVQLLDRPGAVESSSRTRPD